MDQIDQPEKEIIKWSDGTDTWAMIIEPGKVEFKTTAQVPEEALRSHSEAWTEAFKFVNDAFVRAGMRGPSGKADQ